MTSISDLTQLLKYLNPKLNPGTYVFATLEPNQEIKFEDIVAFVREPEGVSVIVDEVVAKSLNLKPSFLCAWITLTVISDLHAVGLTAAFASVLGNAGISCNVVAGTNHDHIFVPVDQADAAMKELLTLQLDPSTVGEQ